MLETMDHYSLHVPNVCSMISDGLHEVTQNGNAALWPLSLSKTLKIDDPIRRENEDVDLGRELVSPSDQLHVCLDLINYSH